MCSRKMAELGDRADRSDDEVQFVSGINLARYAVGLTGRGELGFGKIRGLANTLRVDVPHEEHGDCLVFRPHV